MECLNISYRLGLTCVSYHHSLVHISLLNLSQPTITSDGYPRHLHIANTQNKINSSSSETALIPSTINSSQLVVSVHHSHSLLFFSLLIITDIHNRDTTTDDIKKQLDKEKRKRNTTSTLWFTHCGKTSADRLPMYSSLILNWVRQIHELIVCTRVSLIVAGPGIKALLQCLCLHPVFTVSRTSIGRISICIFQHADAGPAWQICFDSVLSLGVFAACHPYFLVMFN